MFGMEGGGGVKGNGWQREEGVKGYQKRTSLGEGGVAVAVNARVRNCPPRAPSH